jgi:hypothetical protein
VAYTLVAKQWLCKQRPLLGNARNNRRTVFSMWPAPRSFTTIEGLFSAFSVPRSCLEDSFCYNSVSSLTSTLIPIAGGYNWVTLFLGDINTGTWPSRLGESRIWDRKIWSRVLWDSDPRMTALARTSSNCKWQTRSLVRESALHQQTRNCLTVTKIWS